MSVVDIAKSVIKTEILGLDYMSSQLGDEFIEAVNAIISTTGRTIICGMGKSGIIGKKIAASFASTGTPSFFMHPGEAFHGDLGMVKPEDVFIAISNSGETDEVLKLLPFLRDNGNYIIAITGRPESTLAKNSHCHLNIEVPKEACPLQLAPTSSTTATLVMGDALTVALMSERNFKPENFARFHPGGSLGRRLLSKVRDEMVKDNLPVVLINDHFSTVINVISAGQLGLCLVMDEDELVGIITDGDIRRSMETHGKNVFDLLAESIVTRSPLSISPDVSIQVAYEQMHDKNVTSLVVLEANTLVGVIKK
ncbi:KpsF/GutQ family sugar-phosphate isomerase [Photobacterium damselae subsp. damselae]|uniref:KpsF/GutQ family sugar-phosphate isomerase n=1 Tax=Photobacterium damselae TaxID=38293 RepID=UPI000D07F6F3|nr:KpsF/GutQ family sugar-phosphate isomerase [Photobacterium damselae]PSB87039.1 KpsF/GutQ family sugar-phosphate isomerase [Photobacterium damselae subsp. damselae]